MLKTHKNRLPVACGWKVPEARIKKMYFFYTREFHRRYFGKLTIFIRHRLEVEGTRVGSKIINNDSDLLVSVRPRVITISNKKELNNAISAIPKGVGKPINIYEKCDSSGFKLIGSFVSARRAGLFLGLSASTTSP